MCCSFLCTAARRMLRLKYLQSNTRAPPSSTPAPWIMLVSHVGVPRRLGSWGAFLVHASASIALALVAASIVLFYCPDAGGSGIPEVRVRTPSWTLQANQREERV
eukprot:915899-Rhodomonas_salina.3